VRVIVLGGGVIGVTSAYFLRKAGHEVTVVERQPGPALETSFANAGEISPGYASPWAGPGVPVKAVKWLLMHHGPLVLRPKLDPSMWVWMASMLRNCTAERYAVNKARMVRVAEYSRDVLKALRADTGIAYDERTRGTLQVFRTRAQVDGAHKDTEVLKDYGVAFETLDRAGCVAAEPGLATSADKIVGGLRLPGDETGDCHMFTKALAKLAADLGVTFRFDTKVERLIAAGDRVTGVATSAGVLSADAYVVALGSFSPLLVRPLGVNAPVYPVKGYSATIPIVDEAHAPVSTVMDETYKIAITRLGDRIRVGGTAEVSGYALAVNESRKATLNHSVGDLFPGGGDMSRATYWTGLRPMTPDGTPIIGGTRYPNLWLNTGHGTLGWTMACGSARITADLLSGTTPDIDVSDLSLARY
jgi:D-amino-acid dehydrogenase